MVDIVYNIISSKPGNSSMKRLLNDLPKIISFAGVLALNPMFSSFTIFCESLSH